MHNGRVNKRVVASAARHLAEAVCLSSPIRRDGREAHAIVGWCSKDCSGFGAVRIAEEYPVQRDAGCLQTDKFEHVDALQDLRHVNPHEPKSPAAASIRTRFAYERPMDRFPDDATTHPSSQRNDQSILRRQTEIDRKGKGAVVLAGIPVGWPNRRFKATPPPVTCGQTALKIGRPERPTFQPW